MIVASQSDDAVESQALINFSVNESQLSITSDTNVPTSSSEDVEDLLKFDENIDENSDCTVGVVKTIPSDCSVITLSSDGSQEPPLNDLHNESVEYKNEDMFERTISCPPLQLPEVIFDDSADANMENHDTDDTKHEDKRKKCSALICISCITNKTLKMVINFFCIYIHRFRDKI